MNMEIPVYKIQIDLNDEESGMSAISLVDFPAIESNFLVFSKQHKFTIQDEMEHKVSGCAIWCDKPIYRYDATIGDYYVVFDRQTIEDIVLKYSRKGLNNVVDLQHNGEMVDGVTMVEYFIKDSEKGINPKGFEEIADGSLFVTYKIDNDELWNAIIEKESDFKGFSIEIQCDVVPTNQTIGQNAVQSDYDSDFDELLKWLQSEDFAEKKKPSRADISRVIDKKEIVKINKHPYAIHSLGKKDDTDIIVIWDIDKGRYLTMPLKDITDFQPTTQAIPEELPQLPSEIVEDESVTVQRSIWSSDFYTLIHNRVPVMLSYNDDKPNPHTGYRQVAVVAWGKTLANNECFRVMQLYGDSRSAADGDNYIPNYRLMLTERIVSLKPMQGVEPYGLDILDSRYNWQGDRSMSAVYEHLTREDFK